MEHGCNNNASECHEQFAFRHYFMAHWFGIFPLFLDQLHVRFHTFILHLPVLLFTIVLQPSLCPPLLFYFKSACRIHCSVCCQYFDACIILCRVYFRSVLRLSPSSCCFAARWIRSDAAAADFVLGVPVRFEWYVCISFRQFTLCCRFNRWRALFATIVTKSSDTRVSLLNLLSMLNVGENPVSF